MNIRVKELLGLAAGNGQCFIPTRANVIEAEQFCKDAKHIIDTDLDSQDRINLSLIHISEPTRPC